jgi:hypothetical protein
MKTACKSDVRQTTSYQRSRHLLIVSQTISFFCIKPVIIIISTVSLNCLRSNDIKFKRRQNVRVSKLLGFKLYVGLAMTAKILFSIESLSRIS